MSSFFRIEDSRITIQYTSAGILLPRMLNVDRKGQHTKTPMAADADILKILKHTLCTSGPPQSYAP
jgi:hypothetical protein